MQCLYDVKTCGAFEPCSRNEYACGELWYIVKNARLKWVNTS